MRVPFFPDRYLDFGVWNLPILFFIVLGTVNGVNFTDGLDGLAGSVTLMVTVFFTAVAIGGKERHRAGDLRGGGSASGLSAV